MREEEDRHSKKIKQLRVQQSQMSQSQRLQQSASSARASSGASSGASATGARAMVGSFPASDSRKKTVAPARSSAFGGGAAGKMKAPNSASKKTPSRTTPLRQGSTRAAAKKVSKQGYFTQQSKCS